MDGFGMRYNAPAAWVVAGTLVVMVVGASYMAGRVDAHWATWRVIGGMGLFAGVVGGGLITKQSRLLGVASGVVSGPLLTLLIWSIATLVNVENPNGSQRWLLIPCLLAFLPGWLVYYGLGRILGWVRLPWEDGVRRQIEVE